MKRFSTFKSVKDTTPSSAISTWDLIHSIKCDDYKDTCDAIRSAPDKDTRSTLKARLPAVTASGVFSKRAASALVEHSGILIADLDLDDNPQLLEHMPETRARLERDSSVHFLFKSPSGGLKVGVKIDATDSNTHKAAFVTVRDWFLDTHGLVIDKACSDVSRLCFLSHDIEAHYNGKAKVIKTIEEKAASTPFWQPKPVAAPMSGDSPGDQFNAKGDVKGMLQSNGWTTRNGKFWTRPGKSHGVSGTFGVVGERKFFCWSSEAAPLEANQSYSPFALFAAFYHENDFKAAAQALADDGYGEQAEPVPPVVSASIEAMVAKAMAKGVRITQVIEAEKKTEAPTASSKPVPQSVYDNAPAIIREFQEWAEGEAIVPQPFLSLAAGLALMSVTCGRKYSFRGQRSNLFIVVSAPSSAGKENGRKALKAALSRPCAIDMLGSGSVASDTAILRTLEEKKRVLFPFDEVGHMIANNKAAKGAAHLANIAPTLMELYSSAGGIWPGRSYADKDNNIAPIEDPHLCIYGTTTPIMVKQAFTPEDAQTGFTGRVLFFQSFDEPVPRIKPNGAKFPNGVRDYIEFMCASDPKALSGDLAFLNQSKEIPCAKELPCDGDASDLLREFQLRLHAQKVKNQCDSIKGIIGKAYEICMRVAICAAVAENYRNPRITAKAAQWAIDLVQYLTDECLVMAEKNMHNTELDEECEKILCKIRSTKGGVSRREIMQTVKGIGERGSAADYGKVLAELEIRELINTEKLGKKEIYTAA